MLRMHFPHFPSPRSPQSTAHLKCAQSAPTSPQVRSQETRSLCDSRVLSRSWTARNAVLKVTDGRAVGAHPVPTLPTVDPRDCTAAGSCGHRPASLGRVRPRSASPARGPRPELTVSLSHHLRLKSPERNHHEPGPSVECLCAQMCTSLSGERTLRHGLGVLNRWFCLSAAHSGRQQCVRAPAPPHHGDT